MRKLIIAFVAGLSAAPAGAEKAPMSPAQLRKTATHVIVGKVTGVFKRAKTDGRWKYTLYVAEVLVGRAEKGAGLAKGDLAYVRYWQRRWAGPGLPPPSTSGHRGLPDSGDSLRIYLARNAYDGFTFDNKDGGFNVIGANGFEKLKPGR